jgi:hypothetical protein
VGKEVVAAVSLKNKFSGVGNKQRMLVTIFQQHNDELACLVRDSFQKERWKDMGFGSNEFVLATSNSLKDVIFLTTITLFSVPSFCLTAITL